mmetsp:Transcript_18981/g.55065  ORF Transcript_18981/g.55065 Transcript_18981/m.55065 type:complete len:244 (+) Transcript_18981:1059-1790(+)
MVELLDAGEVDMGAPRYIVKTLPVDVRGRAVHKRRRDREGPIVVEPPECEPARHPLAQALPPEGRLFRRCLQAARPSPGHGVRVVVEVCAQAVCLEVREPVCEVWEERGVWVVVEVVLAIGGVAPIHVQGPDVNRQLAALPMLNVPLRLRHGVRVPVGEPRAVREVREQRHGPRQRQQLAPRGAPAGQAGAQQEHVAVPRHVVAEVVAVRREERRIDRRLGGYGPRTPGRRVEARVVDQGVAP